MAPRSGGGILLTSGMVQALGWRAPLDLSHGPCARVEGSGGRRRCAPSTRSGAQAWSRRPGGTDHERQHQHAHSHGKIQRQLPDPASKGIKPMVSVRCST